MSLVDAKRKLASMFVFSCLKNEKELTSSPCCSQEMLSLHWQDLISTLGYLVVQNGR